MGELGLIFQERSISLINSAFSYMVVFIEQKSVQGKRQVGVARIGLGNKLSSKLISQNLVIFERDKKRVFWSSQLMAPKTASRQNYQQREVLRVCVLMSQNRFMKNKRCWCTASPVLWKQTKSTFSQGNSPFHLGQQYKQPYMYLITIQAYFSIFSNRIENRISASLSQSQTTSNNFLPNLSCISFLANNRHYSSYISILPYFFRFIKLQSNSMGVCISACAKVPNHPNMQIQPQDKQMIAQEIQNLQTPSSPHAQNDARDGSIEDILKTKENQPASSQESEEEQKQQIAEKSQETISSHQEQKMDEEAKDEKKKVTAEREKQVSKYFIGRGKTVEDNELIRQVIAAVGIIKMPKIQLDNGISYEGEWKDGQREGLGEQIWADGSRYVGEWRNNQANGKGILHHADGDVYDGEWLNDKASGHGTYTHSNGACYVGEWIQDKQNGLGRQVWPDGEVYEGEYKNGCKNGKGLLKFVDQSYYDGEFSMNEIHGKGIYVWFNNKKYEGQWVHNKMSGYGITTWIDGRIYEGEYLDDKKHGFGTFTWPDGRKYKGNWEDGKQHGRGQYFLPNGESKIGEWVNGKKVRWINDEKNFGMSN